MSAEAEDMLTRLEAKFAGRKDATKEEIHAAIEAELTEFERAILAERRKPRPTLSLVHSASAGTAEGEEAGALSQSEAAFAAEARLRAPAPVVDQHVRDGAMAIYHSALRRAELMLDELRDATVGGFAMVDVAEFAKIARAIDRHVMAQCWLREAAQGVVDAFDYDDNGRAAGIVWSTPIGAGASA